ncbi:alkylmercury lyase family protein [Blastococcus sp. PRF04-17]|uniref:alkylmercury lyase family protein n=1 Tax=Blastococcus sp. PRF04-17 TaxID=2933797 RepID=UPI001FF2020F|nr:alkylmercury lyase family protein [Blastococcus sp. PRF04-17]UOY03511.1 alkylmercury lyase family protein [Blastococcus sp. PRF04-17]
MNLFRSEEHVRRWLGDRPAGATLPVTTLSALAHAWWGDRLASDWVPHARDSNQAILDRLGLVGEFWQLP